MAKYNEALAEKINRFLQRQSVKVNEFCQTMGEMVLRAVSRLIAVFVTIFVIWYEFPELSKNPEFLYLLLVWGLYTVVIFWLDYRQSKRKTIEDKLSELLLKVDELITEMRKSRNG